MKITKNILGAVLLAAVLSGCGSKSPVSLTSSERTGWAYNKPDKGFFNVKSQYDGKVPPGTVYVSTNSFVKGQNEDPVSSPSNDLKRRVGVDGFFMDECEVTNINWREYEAWMRGVYKHDPRKILLAMPDETVWRQELAYNEPLVNNYYRHVAYGFYPVVGVSWTQAMEYCKWRTDRVNERILIDNKIIEFTDLETINGSIEGVEDTEQSKYIFTTAKRYDYLRELNGEDFEIDLDGVIFEAEYRLPTEAEWEFAAYSAIDYRQNFEEGKTYPWQGYQLREMYKKKTKGQFIANFMRGRGDAIGQYTNNSRTVPVDAFPPNEYGLYNMAGNVNEWVLDVYRSTSNDLVNELAPFRGNEYVSDSAYAETILDRLPPMEKEVRDSMRNVLVKEKKFTVSGSDVRNFRDGDINSVVGDSILRYEDATPIEQATMISDRARVYKGGSWKDRAIWLNPATRRWLDQDARSSEIGFRCAMSAVGGKRRGAN
ncbi:MAG: SUMF1/EgtB/PvdO family nonheme iron enzyme [Prevotellaceae bacterium]|jgi:formylglycine-generating enzyme required for sulfatase activity|nr:SUMF1/EgtB/PvdO family nonheme iron enzyme [Prevotellaceae bacterium]